MNANEGAISAAEAEREDMIADEIAACPGCGSYEFPRRSDCESCIAAVDERIAAVALMNRHAPTFDTAAFTAEELAAASVCGPTDLPDCVPGGCGGLVVEMPDCRAKTADDNSSGGQRVEALQLDAETLFNVYAMADGNTMDGMRAVSDYVKSQVEAFTAALSNGETP